LKEMSLVTAWMMKSSKALQQIDLS
jgi:hypothetical protein